ncbi:MAG: hypothetical protein Q9205_007396 [Flavoplaca limonia]
MPLDHSSLTVPPSAVAPLITFLTSSLAHLGFKEHIRFGPHVIGMGEEMPYFWLVGIVSEDADEKTVKEVLGGGHFAFGAGNAEQVRKFHAEALKAGASDNGKPGLRPQYHPGYYAAFVRDPVVGVNFEVVCHNCVGEKEVGEEGVEGS